MDMFLQQILNGLTLGSVYCLVALGLTLVYGILQVPNFAHGAFYMAGAFVAFQLISAMGWNYWAALLTSALGVAALAALSGRLVFHPLRNSSGLHPMIAAIGLLLFLEASAQAIWGADFRRMPTPFIGVFEIGTVGISQQRLLLIGSAVVLVCALQVFLKHTVVGATIVALAQNREGAALMGIDTNRVAMLTFAVSGALAAAAAVLYSPINLVYPAMGSLVITKAFAIIVIGGMGSVPGAIVGGLIIGVAESFGAFYVSSDAKDLIAFAILVVILSFRPQGIFTRGGL